MQAVSSGSQIDYLTLNDVNDTLPDDFPDGQEALTPYNYTRYLLKLNEPPLLTKDEIGYEIAACKTRGGRRMENILYWIIKSSTNNPDNSIAAANAIMILKTMRVALSALDLRGIQIPNADLSEAILDDADLSGANLENVNFANSSLNRTKLNNAILTGANLGGLSQINISLEIKACIISPSGKFAIIRCIDEIQVWNIEQRQRIEKKSWSTNLQISRMVCIDDKFFIINDEEHIYVFDIEKLEKINTIKKHNVKLGTNSKLNITLSPDKKLLVIAEQHENSTKMSVWQRQSVDDSLLKFTEIIPEKTKAYNIDKIFFLDQGDQLITIKGDATNSIIQLRNSRTLKQIRTALKEDGLKLFGRITENAAIGIIHDSLHTMYLDENSDVIFQQYNPIPMFSKTCRIRSLCCNSNGVCVAFIKDNFDLSSDIYFLNRELTDPLTEYSWYNVDILGDKVDDIYISEDGSLLFQMLYEKGKIYFQNRDSIKKKDKILVMQAEAISHVSFSAGGEEVIVYEDSNATELHSIFKYPTLTGNTSYIFEKEESTVEKMIKANRGCLSYYVSGSGIAQMEGVLNGFNQELYLLPLEDKLRSFNLNEISICENTKLEYTAITSVVTNDGKFNLLVKNDYLVVKDIERENEIYSCTKEILNLEFGLNEINRLAISPNFSKNGGYIAFTNGKSTFLVNLIISHGERLVTGQIDCIKHSDDKIFDLKFTQNALFLTIIGEDVIYYRFNTDNNYKFTCKMSKYIDKEKSDAQDMLENKLSIFDVSSGSSRLLVCSQRDEVVTDKKSQQYGKKYNIISFIDIAGERIFQKEIIPGPIGVKFSPNSNLFVSWLWKGNNMHMWHYINNKAIRVLWRSKSNLVAYKLDITTAKELPPDFVKEILIYAGASDGLSRS